MSHEFLGQKLFFWFSKKKRKKEKGAKLVKVKIGIVTLGEVLVYVPIVRTPRWIGVNGCTRLAGRRNHVNTVVIVRKYDHGHETRLSLKSHSLCVCVEYKH